MRPELPHPLPYQYATEIEMLLADVGDRENTVYNLRRHFGRIYAQGYEDGRMVANTEKYYDYQYNAAQEKETDD